MNDVPRYATLRDYLKVLRRSRLILLVSTVVFAAGAYAITARDKSVYSAQSTLSFQDVDQETANLLDTSVTPDNEATARVQINAATITRPQIVSQVAKLLPNLPADELTSGVSAAEQTSTGFLVIQVNSTSPQRAQVLANAYADAVQTEERNLARSQFAAAAAKLTRLVGKPGVKNNPIALDTDEERISDLEFAAQTANPVSIATNAVAPSTPISPHPVRDAILGLVLGLVIGVVIAFGRDALDRRVRGSQEITEELDWPILGHIMEGALGYAGFISGSSGKRPKDSDLEGFRILRQNIQFMNLDQPPRSIVVTSAKPEEGKSTVAASLACASALSGTLTLLVDCDLRRPTLAGRLGVDSRPGLTEYLLGEAEPADILRTVPLDVGSSNNGSRESVPDHIVGSKLTFIPSGRPTEYSSELLGSARLRDFLAQVSAAYELVVIDTSPVLPVADALELMAEAQGTLFCVRTSKTTGSELRAVKHAIDRVPSHPAGVVITGVRSGSEEDFGYYPHGRYYS